MDSNEILVEFQEMLKVALPLFISFWCISFAFRIISSLTGPFGIFDVFKGFLGNGKQKEDIVIPEEKPYKINLSKDKSCK